MQEPLIDTRSELIEGCKRGDRYAQKKLYEEYADAMYNVCYRMLQNHEDAQDVLQNAFVKVFQNLDKFKYESTPGAWIKRIVVNHCMNHFRKEKGFVEEWKDYDMPDEDPVDIEESLYEVDIIKKAINALPEGYRAVAVLYLFEGYDHQEIAQVLKISESTSKTQFHRAKKKLKELLKEYKIAC